MSPDLQCSFPGLCIGVLSVCQIIKTVVFFRLTTDAYMSSQSGIPWLHLRCIHAVPGHWTTVNLLLPEPLRVLAGAPSLWRRTLTAQPPSPAAGNPGQLLGANVHIHPLLPFLILLVPEPLMVKRPVVRAGQCQENATEYQDTIKTLEATLQKGLEMGIHKRCRQPLQKEPEIQRAGLRRKDPEHKGSEFRDEQVRRNFAEVCPCHLGTFKLRE